MTVSGCVKWPVDQKSYVISDMEKTCAFNGGMLGGYQIETKYDKTGAIVSMVCTFPNKSKATLNFCKAKP